jgi:hypothetical protein
MLISAPFHNGLHPIAPVDVDRHAHVHTFADGKVIYVVPDEPSTSHRTGRGSQWHHARWPGHKTEEITSPERRLFPCGPQSSACSNSKESA